MVNFHNPPVIAQDDLAMTKLWHIVQGLYMWEFFTTLEYEWSVIRGRLPYRWTIWIYSLARVAALLGVVLRFVFMDDRGPVNCQVTFSFTIVFSFVSTSASSLLIVLRVIAIWNRNKVIVSTAIGLWGINVAFLIQGAARLRSSWVSAELGCFSVESLNNTPTLIAILVTDIALLLAMLGGLYRLRRIFDYPFGLTHLLWKQGVIWLVIAIAAEVPLVVFVTLNLNIPFNVMFQSPSYITLVIAATRMHRSLVDFTRRSTDVFDIHENIQENHFSHPKTKDNNAAFIPNDQMEVVVHAISEQHRTPQIRDDSSCVSTDERSHDQADGLNRTANVEHGAV